MNIVNFSKTIKFKILVWSLIGFGALFVFIGAILMFTSGGDVNPTAMQISASGTGLTTDYYGNYNLDVYTKQTAIMVNTNPGNSTTKPVTFEILEGKDCATINSSIRSGGLATLTLKEDTTNNGAFKYNREIRILVKCGQNLQEYLNVNIRVPEKQTRFEFTLRKGTSPVLNNEISAQTYKKESSAKWSPYKLDAKFMVLDTQIKEATSIETENRVKFAAVCLNSDYDVVLFGDDIGFENIYIPSEIIDKISASSSGSGMTLRFMITATFLNKDYIDFFEFSIVN